MSGSNAGTGCPLTFRCTVERRERGRGRTGSLHRVQVTGNERPSSAKHSARMDRVEREYRCSCGHHGWSRHIDLANRVWYPAISPAPLEQISPITLAALAGSRLSRVRSLCERRAAGDLAVRWHAQVVVLVEILRQRGQEVEALQRVTSKIGHQIEDTFSNTSLLPVDRLPPDLIEDLERIVRQDVLG